MLAVSWNVICDFICYMLQKVVEDRPDIMNFQGYVLTFQYLL